MKEWNKSYLLLKLLHILLYWRKTALRKYWDLWKIIEKNEILKSIYYWSNTNLFLRVGFRHNSPRGGGFGSPCRGGSSPSNRGGYGYGSPSPRGGGGGYSPRGGLRGQNSNQWNNSPRSVKICIFKLDQRKSLVLP